MQNLEPFFPQLPLSLDPRDLLHGFLLWILLGLAPAPAAVLHRSDLGRDHVALQSRSLVSPHSPAFWSKAL